MGKAVRIEFDEASLRRMYKRIDPDNLIKDPIESFYKRVAKTIQQKAKHNVPVDTGALKQSIKIDKTVKRFGGGVSGLAVVVRSPYGLFVHEGSKPHFPPVEALRGWAERRGLNPYAVAVGISKRGTRAQPFLRKAVEQTQRSLPIELSATVSDIDRAWKGRG